jgi:D-3-phosphoglycerate dehydrogenase
MAEKIKLAITCGYVGELECYRLLQEAGIEYAPVGFDKPYIEMVRGYDCVFAGGETFDRGIFEALPQLKFIIRHGIGYDAIDLDAASEAGVAVANLPGSNADSVGEFALALLLCAGQQIVPYNDACKGKGPWPSAMARSISGTVGLVGFGAIARSFAKYIKPFNIDKIIACDPYVGFDDMARLGVEKCEMHDIQREADIVSLHMPWTKETYHMIDAEFFNGLQKKIILVNTARGQLVDNDALCDALAKGMVEAAGIDVLDGLAPPGSPLYSLPNVVLTPHVATNNMQCRVRVNELGVKAVIDFFAKKPVPSILNPGYIKNARRT